MIPYEDFSDDGATLDEHDRLDLPPEVEYTLLAVWRRVVTEGGGPELTLPEAAVLLGTSVQSVRRRVKAGRLTAFHDARGRLRIVPTLAPPAPAEETQAAGPADMAALLLDLKTAQRELERRLSEVEELRGRLATVQMETQDTRDELARSRHQSQEFQEELETARQALENTQRELASLWRVMSSRSRQRSLSQRFGLSAGNEAFDLNPGRTNMAQERARIQSQISHVRELSRRRRWPWPQAG